MLSHASPSRRQSIHGPYEGSRPLNLADPPGAVWAEWRPPRRQHQRGGGGGGGGSGAGRRVSASGSGGSSSWRVHDVDFDPFAEDNNNDDDYDDDNVNFKDEDTMNVINNNDNADPFDDNSTPDWRRKINGEPCSPNVS